MKTNVYISYYFYKNAPFPPTYLVHKANNIKQANQIAYWYLSGYLREQRKSAQFINDVMKHIKIISKRSKL